MADDCKPPPTDPWIEAALEAAWLARDAADCKLNQVGAVATLGTAIVATAANHPTAPRDRCPGADDCEQDGHLDPVTGVCTRGEHAEAALIQALTSAGLRADTVTLTSVPCPNCAELLARHGVNQLVLLGTPHAYSRPQLEPFQIKLFSRQRYATDGSLVEIEAP